MACGLNTRSFDLAGGAFLTIDSPNSSFSSAIQARPRPGHYSRGRYRPFPERGRRHAHSLSSPSHPAAASPISLRGGNDGKTNRSRRHDNRHERHWKNFKLLARWRL